MLDALEAAPFPEAQFGVQEPPSEVTRPDDAGSASNENGPQSTNPPATWPMTFRSAPWNEVLDWYSTIAGLPLQADEMPDGTFNYVDAQQHSLDDITDILQPVLRTKGMLLKRQPQRIELIRLAGNESGNVLGIDLPSRSELAARRESFLELKARIDKVDKRRESIPREAADRQQQLAIIQAETDSLMAEHEAAKKILEVESDEAKLAAGDTERLLERLAAINTRSADCVPQHTLLRLQRELLAMKAAIDEINAILDLARVVERKPTLR
jgi:hypothetical protein